MRFLLSAFALVSLFAGQALADESCSAENYRWNDRPGVAELHELRLPAAAETRIDPGSNGGIRVHGWNNPDVLVKACVHAGAASEGEAHALIQKVKIVRGPGDIRPDGPANSHSQHWDVSYEIWVPNRSSLDMHATNGGINIESVEGKLRFHTQNGGVHLKDIAGDVDGATINGGLTIELTGSSWRGAGLRAETENGGVHMLLPEGYSANFEASTVNGGMHVDFPVQVSGNVGKSLSFQLGQGGPTIRTRTTNGGVRIGRA